MTMTRRTLFAAVATTALTPLLLTAAPDAAWAQGRTLAVGPGLYYTMPSQAAKDAQDGDIVLIQPGTYENDVATWEADDLTIRGDGGTAEIIARDGRVAGNKAIWVVTGDRTTIEGVHLSGARSSHQNGAGIRLEGTGLTLRDCAITDSQMGILSGNNSEGVVVIERCRFHNNGVGIDSSGSIGHNIYIGGQKRFEMRFSSSTGANVGHAVKSRARENVIAYNHIADHEDGRASYLIDLPEGGDSLVIGNVIQQGPLWENNALISYGAEKKGQDIGRLTLSHNTMVNTADDGTFINNYGTAPVTMMNDLLVGPGMVSNGEVEATGQVSLAAGPSAKHFADPAAFDYRLKSGAPAVDAGAEVPAELRPTHSFVYGDGAPKVIERKTNGAAPDAGAFEE